MKYLQYYVFKLLMSYTVYISNVNVSPRTSSDNKGSDYQGLQFVWTGQVVWAIVLLLLRIHKNVDLFVCVSEN